MEARAIVILYGASLALAGLETCLHGLPGLTVVRFDRKAPDTEESIRSLQPVAIIFDSLDPHTRSWPPLTRMLKEIPQVVLIGYDANSSDLMLLTGHREDGGNVADVVAAIRGRRVPLHR